MGMFSAASDRAGWASGTSTTSSWPMRTLYAGSTGAPSTSTWPSFASRAMALRDRRLRAARKRSTRCPPSSTRSAIRSPTQLRRLRRRRAVLLVPERGGDEDDPDHDRRVRDVERPEPDLADADVDEIDDVALRDSIEQVPEGATELHPERRRHERRVARDLAVVVDDREDRDDREHRQERRALGQETERGAGVLRVDDPHVLPNDGARRAERDVFRDPGLR